MVEKIIIYFSFQRSYKRLKIL